MLKKSFTLIELLAVIVIGLILMSLTLGVAVYVRNVGIQEKTRANLAKSVQLLENYRNDRGVYPKLSNVGELWADVLTQSAHGVERYKHSETGRPYIPEMVGAKSFLDGWGRPLRYICNVNSSDYNGKSLPYLLWSKGPDGADEAAYSDKEKATNLDNIYSND